LVPSSSGNPSGIPFLRLNPTLNGSKLGKLFSNPYIFSNKKKFEGVLETKKDDYPTSASYETKPLYENPIYLGKPTALVKITYPPLSFSITPE
jgi:hypothetical protein